MIYINSVNRIYFENKQGEYHRENGPAFIRGIYQTWWKNGKRHRIGGPAVIYANIEYWIENIEYTECDYENILKTYS